ncbi:sarcosine oxidase subunit alpha family protein [Steroidobacter sp.]|uniref:sarcosine oxidase subunit alpha family protein n=1 Tax=Steroidobacter sp. TaxID=1978227 RepID=UPI001A5953BE|nr:sarcosine oxidase subunit alpha family protein [Steroidobacter sp.]MBL8270259.1 sarcosine oxidase subunit alpha family protein [Steroidobacter sp.]
MSAHRVAQGGQLDRSQTLSFTFNGRALQGHAGDTLASALLANGISVVARSFKYHRPRGIFSAGVEEPNALLRVAINGLAVPLVRATVQPLVDGMVVTSENCFPSVDFDVGRVFDRVHGLLPAGFYNKTFKWPNWHTYEDAVRRMAGLGTLPSGEDKTEFFRHHLRCDVLVVGAGIAGLSAAREASRAGARVVLIEQDGQLGGRALLERVDVEGLSARSWVSEVADELERSPKVQILRRTMVAGYYDHNVLTALDLSDNERPDGPVQRFWIIRAREVVLATGAIEQPLMFAHNDRPGIMLAGAVRTYLNRYGVATGRRAVIATNNDDAYRTAFDLHDAGIEVPAIVDAREAASVQIEKGVERRGLKVIRSAMVVDTRGSSRLKAVAVNGVSSDGRKLGNSVTWIACDTLAVSSGWNPTVHLYSQAGGKVRYDASLACIVPESCRQRVRIVGAANAEFAVSSAVASGARAGREAATTTREKQYVSGSVPRDHRSETNGIRAIRRAPQSSNARQWVDLLHDVTSADIELAARENFVSVEHLKRYTTTGMAVDQGKTSNLNALSVLSELTGRGIETLGTTTYRPQFMPVTFGAIGGDATGDLYAPPRHMPVHRWHVLNGAQLDDYGGWKRPACYLRGAESREAAINREVRAVRAGLGLFEGSPLGKIEVRGRDAANFLHRIYMNNVISLQPGKVRYGLMLNENGIVIDDGVFACLSPEHYLVSTTGGNAERIAGWLDEWHQCEWPDLDLVLTPVTTQWAVLTLAGAAARALLQELPSDIDFSAAAFPHMNFREGQIAGRRARVQRVSFTGELSYEISVPANEAEGLWEELMRRGAKYGIAPVGLEAWLVLRLEKGFLHVGSDTDGTTNPLDLGFGAVIEKKNTDFVGRRSLSRAHDQASSRRQFVGLEPVAANASLVAGAHIVSSASSPRRSEGFVTSAAFSPTLERSIGLALLERGAARIGEIVTIFDEGSTLQARVVKPTFFDSAGERMNG